MIRFLGMPGPINKLKLKAQKKFLGRNSVVGVGVGGPHEHELVFLLEEDAHDTRTKISRWARQHKIKVQIHITGKIRSA
jgi:hypothetical protein